MIYKKINACRICGNENLEPVLNLGMQALTGVFPHQNETVESGPLELVRCVSNSEEKTCGLLQLAHNYSLEAMYGDNYGYRSGLNKSMVKHLESLVKKIEDTVNIKNDDLIIDIGSNDCTLLKTYKNQNSTLIGIDPTSNKFKEYYPEHITNISDFFSADAIKDHTSKKAKVITSIAMFYDLENPIQFAKDIEETLDDDGIWVLEQSYMPMMIENISYDTVCHEHLEYYGVKQIKWIMDKSNLKIIDISTNGTNGASFCITVAKKNSKHNEKSSLVTEFLNQEKSLGLDSLDVYENFAEKTEQHKNELVSQIENLIKDKKTIFGYGASTKGNVILQYCNFTLEQIPYIAEVNPYKFGRKTPGSNIPIISEEEAKKLNPDYYLVLPWHFKENIIERESEYLNSGGKLIFPLPKIEIISSDNS